METVSAKYHRGEVATFLTIAAMVVVGASVFVSSLITKNNQNNIGPQRTQASGNCQQFPTELAAPAPRATSSSEGYYWEADCNSIPGGYLKEQYRSQRPYCTNNEECQQNTTYPDHGYIYAGSSAWCYGFSSGSRCAMLHYNRAGTAYLSGGQQQPTNTPVPPPAATATSIPQSNCFDSANNRRNPGESYCKNNNYYYCQQNGQERVEQNCVSQGLTCGLNGQGNVACLAGPTQPPQSNCFDSANSRRNPGDSYCKYGNYYYCQSSGQERVQQDCVGQNASCGLVNGNIACIANPTIPPAPTFTPVPAPPGSATNTPVPLPLAPRSCTQLGIVQGCRIWIDKYFYCLNGNEEAFGPFPYIQQCNAAYAAAVANQIRLSITPIATNTPTPFPRGGTCNGGCTSIDSTCPNGDGVGSCGTMLKCCAPTPLPQGKPCNGFCISVNNTCPNGNGQGSCGTMQQCCANTSQLQPSATPVPFCAHFHTIQLLEENFLPITVTDESGSNSARATFGHYFNDYFNRIARSMLSQSRDMNEFRSNLTNSMRNNLHIPLSNALTDIANRITVAHLFIGPFEIPNPTQIIRDAINGIAISVRSLGVVGQIINSAIDATVASRIDQFCN